MGDNLNDKIMDIFNNIQIITKEQAKYLGKIINSLGILTTNFTYKFFLNKSKIKVFSQDLPKLGCS